MRITKIDKGGQEHLIAELDKDQALDYLDHVDACYEAYRRAHPEENLQPLPPGDWERYLDWAIQRQGESMTELKPNQCASCGICISPNFMETVAYQVGKFRICGWCKAQLAAHGYIELADHCPTREQVLLCKWLYPNGSVKPIRRTLGGLVIEVKDSVTFVPREKQDTAEVTTKTVE